MFGGGMLPLPKSRPRTPTSRRRSSVTGRCGTRVTKRLEPCRSLKMKRGAGRSGRVDHARAAVVPVGVVVRIVEHHDPETDAGVVVRAPVWIADVAVAVVAEEARVIVVLLHVVRRDVVVPVGVAVRDDALGEVGEGDIRVAAYAAIRNSAIIPMIFALHGIVDEGIGG